MGGGGGAGGRAARPRGRGRGGGGGPKTSPNQQRSLNLAHTYPKKKKIAYLGAQSGLSNTSHQLSRPFWCQKQRLWHQSVHAQFVCNLTTSWLWLVGQKGLFYLFFFFFQRQEDESALMEFPDPKNRGRMRKYFVAEKVGNARPDITCIFQNIMTGSTLHIFLSLTRVRHRLNTQLPLICVAKKKKKKPA